MIYIMINDGSPNSLCDAMFFHKDTHTPHLRSIHTKNHSSWESDRQDAFTRYNPLMSNSYSRSVHLQISLTWTVCFTCNSIMSIMTGPISQVLTSTHRRVTLAQHVTADTMTCGRC